MTQNLTMAGLDPAIQGHHAGRVPSGFVYILTNKRNGTLYVGVTSSLLDRMAEHRLGAGSKFVKKYGLNHLVWFEEYPLYAAAIQRETSLKRWKREWKLDLIEKANPQWKDLLETWNA